MKFEPLRRTRFWIFCNRRITDQDLESKFWLAKKTIAPPYWNAISRSGQQTLFFYPSNWREWNETSAQQAITERFEKLIEFNTFQKHSGDSKRSTNTYLVSVAAVFQTL